MATSDKKAELLQQFEALLNQADDTPAKRLKELAHLIAEELKDQPQVMNIKEFCELNGMSRNFVMEHQDQIPLFRIPGSDKVMINMVKWREKLSR